MRKKISLVLVFVLIWGWLNPAWVRAGDICMPVEDAKQIVVELQRKSILEKEVTVLNELNESLVKQNSLLEEQNRLLREQLELQKVELQSLKDALDKEKRKSWWDKLGASTFGIAIGAVVGIVGLFVLLK